ncbi:PQQ-dependent sugar dehydrogenase [Pseudomonas fontis]|uniref:PQQ-dependent sugar dehydrogenase n=1 Tax=Pseudomonas fontis TaxID=2942633 RepID=A0ABT5NYZ0_9PSED|nr:PQQ-dependent sugar dehydrogenase [Pseudomonas fontis]MDD0977426.1 PQQ-dependent sugar dehydrogenase [Pseudomonas fontis]MDD0993420.1 PQQ-dependent sugar dehydrogenase [Pseudomonas fontis]
MSSRLWLASLCAATLLPLTALAAPERTFPSELGTLQVSTLAEGLKHPWALAFLPDGQGMLVTERQGNLRIVLADGKVGAPLSGVPQVWAKGQGGLLDVALSPSFKQDRMVYLSFAEGDAKGDKAGTAVGRGRLSPDLSRLEDFNVIFRQQPKLSVGNHFGSRLVFDRDGYLFIALGENNERATSQDLDKLQGKVVRILPDGTVPDDNPFVGQSSVRPEIWSYGHRNQQGAALNPWTGELWTNEHGPRGGDEINIPKPGKNYGWPLATHGINYSLLPIPEAQGKQVKGAVDPHHVWEKSPAISGMAFYDNERFKAWDHSVFIGALAAQEVIRLKLEGDKIVAEERMLGQLNARVRDVRVGPDGFLYVLTDEEDGELLKVGLQP